MLLTVLFSLTDQASFLYLPGHPAQCYHNPQWAKSVTARYPGSQDPSTTPLPLGLLGLCLPPSLPLSLPPGPALCPLSWSCSGPCSLSHPLDSTCCCGFLVVPGTEGLGRVPARASCPQGPGHFPTDSMDFLGRLEFTEKANAPKGGRGLFLIGSSAKSETPPGTSRSQDSCVSPPVLSLGDRDITVGDYPGLW